MCSLSKLLAMEKAKPAELAASFSLHELMLAYGQHIIYGHSEHDRSINLYIGASLYFCYS